MAINIDKAISWFKSMSGTRYSMSGSRNGSDGTGDCSGMLVTALYKGGASKPAWLYNTDSMHDWLIANGFELIAFNKSWNMQKGDVIILGLKGQSTGAAGHTALAIDGTNIIDCAWYGSSSVNAVRVRNENQLPYSMGFYVYRLKKGSTTVSKPQEKNYYQSGNYFVALQDLKTYNRDFSKVDNTWEFKKGSKFAVREIVKMPNGATHAQVAGLGNTYVTLAKSHVKPQ